MERKIETVSGWKIEYHADDYGMFPVQSQRILDCHRNGKLNGISVMPNSLYLDQCMELLRPYRKNIAITVHLNLIEGRSLTPPEEIPMLTDDDGIFRVTFGGLLLRSYLPGRAELRQQLKKELRTQIYSVKRYLEQDQPLRLDGHAHYHMVPVVFDALMDIIREEKLDVSYIRIPKEYPTLYLRHWKELTDFSPINLVKVAVLNILARRNQRKYRHVLASGGKKVFMGVLFSGRMYRQNVAPLLPDALALAEKYGCGLEVLAHPGGVYEEEDIAQLTNQEDIQFLTSGMRRKEYSLFLDHVEGEV